MISKIPKWVLLGGGVLAFAAGMVNVIALLGFAHQAATHVTGLFSRLSIDLFKGDVSGILETFLILLFFFMGAILSGIMIRDAHLKLDDRYVWTLSVECLLLILSTIAFYKGSILGECFAAMAAGLQNAMASTYSGAIIRTTHLTGVVTDFGVLIGHFIQGIKIDPRRFKLFLTLMGSFLAGGFLGALLYGYWGVLAMLAPALVIGASAIGFSYFQKNAQQTGANPQLPPRA